MSGWWAAGLWAGGLTVLVLILALCRAAKLGDQPDPEGDHQP